MVEGESSGLKTRKNLEESASPLTSSLPLSKLINLYESHFFSNLRLGLQQMLQGTLLGSEAKPCPHSRQQSESFPPPLSVVPGGKVYTKTTQNTGTGGMSHFITGPQKKEISLLAEIQSSNKD